MPALKPDLGRAALQLVSLRFAIRPSGLARRALLVLLMILPLAAIFRASLWDDNGISLSRYLEVFTNEQFLKAIWNTLIISTWVGAISVIVGALLAWLVTRTDLPWKKSIRALVMASFVTPPFLGAFAWTLLAGPNAGSLNKLYRAVTGAEDALFNIFSMPGLIFVMALYSFPYVFSMIANVCELISSDLEDAAEILGANKWRTACDRHACRWRMPALIGGFILAFLQSLSLFGAPAILGLPAGLHTITTQIWALFQYPPRLDMAAAFSVPLLLGDDGADRRAKKNPRAQRLQHGRRQRRAETLDPPRLGPHSGAAVCFRHSVAFGVLCRIGFCSRRRSRKAWALPLTWDNFTLQEFFVHFFRIRRYPAGDLQHFQTGHAHGDHRHAARDSDRLHHQSQSVSRRALSDVSLRLAPLVIPGIVLAVGLVYRLHAAAAGAVRHDLDSVRGFFDQRNAHRIFAGGIDFQKHPPGARRREPDHRRQPAHLAQGYYGAAGALGTDRRLVVYFHRRHPRAQRRDSVIRAELESRLRGHFRSQRRRAGGSHRGVGNSLCWWFPSR